MTDDRHGARRVRREAFAQPVELDRDVLAWSQGHASHDFLRDPTGLSIYGYLTRYAVDIAEDHFGRPASELNILDWGSGKGHVSHLLRQLGARPISCDVNDAAGDSSYGQEVPIIEHAGIDVVALDDPVTLPFESATFDVVLSFGVLEHVHNDVGSLGEISRILVHDGLFVCVNLPYTLSWTQRFAHLMGDHYHDRLYGRRQMDSMLADAGFDVLDMWHRQLLPKNDINYPRYRDVDRVDRWLTEHTPLRYLATCLEFTARKR